MRARFNAVIMESDKCFACVEVPPQAAGLLGASDAKFRVNGTIDTVPFTSDVLPSGGVSILCLTSVLCRSIKATFGDTVAISVERADDGRIASIPLDFKKMLAASPDSKAMFEMYSYPNKRDILEWIMDAAGDSVRQSRMERAIVKLGQEYLEYLESLPEDGAEK
jgi:hypothetical protein